MELHVPGGGGGGGGAAAAAAAGAGALNFCGRIAGIYARVNQFMPALALNCGRIAGIYARVNQFMPALALNLCPGPLSGGGGCWC